MPTPSNNTKRWIVNCAGEKIPVTNAVFTTRCALGNVEDYLEYSKEYISPQMLAFGKPAQLSIIIPSHASHLKCLNQTLESLFAQQYTVPTEIIVFVNDHIGASESVRVANDQTLHFVRSLDKTNVNVTLRHVYHQTTHAIGEVYQIALSSILARAQAESEKAGSQRDAKVKWIKNCLKSSLIVFCDDDISFNDVLGLNQAYQNAVQHDGIVCGQLTIEHVVTSAEYEHILRDVMQLFLDFKYDQDLNVLSPKGVLLRHIPATGCIAFDKPFADQMFFASAANDRIKYFIDARTTIAESDYPGNGLFLKNLRFYLEGADNDALDIFKNVLTRYKEGKGHGKYSTQDIENLMTSLKTRNIEKIIELCRQKL